MIRKIITYPDESLNRVSEDVRHFDTELHTLLEHMFDTVKHHKGLGIAAIQIGVPLNVVLVADVENPGTMIEAINPEIIQKDGEQFKQETCLSLPEVQGVVPRAQTITVYWRDRHGEQQTSICHGLQAQIWQHELEHLDGGLYIDNLPKGKLKRLKATYKKRNK